MGLDRATCSEQRSQMRDAEEGRPRMRDAGAWRGAAARHGVGGVEQRARGAGDQRKAGRGGAAA